MKIYILVFIAIMNIAVIKAQTGMMTNNPNSNAVLDLNTSSGVNTKGLVLPKVTLSSTLSPAPLSNHVEGMMLYNTATNGTGTEKVTEGIYYNDGSKWIRIMDSANWEITGNSSTIAATNFIGTTDLVDLVTRTNNTERTRITTTGKVLINTNTTPTGSDAKLVINNGTVKGALQIKDGTEANGKAFTSDINGIGSWKDLGDEAFFTPSNVSFDGVNIPASLATTAFAYLGNSVTLKPGKWLVTTQLFLNKLGGGAPYSVPDSSWWFRATFSDSMTTLGVSADIGVPGANAKYITKTIYYLGGFETVVGSLIINNTSSSAKTYYLAAPGLMGYNVTTTAPTIFDSLGQGSLLTWIYSQRIR